MLESLTNFDYLILIITFISTITAFLSGFVKTVTSIACWVASGFTAVFLAPSLKPSFQNMLGDLSSFAHPVSVAVIFLISLITLSFVSSKILKLAKPITGGAIDHSLGFAFGLIRGTLISCIIFIIIKSLVPIWSNFSKSEKGPKWFASSVTYNLLDKISNLLVDQKIQQREPTHKSEEEKNQTKNLINSMPAETQEALEAFAPEETKKLKINKSKK